MSDPKRLSASNGLARELLASAKADRAPDGAARRLLAGSVVAGALAAKSTSVGASLASTLGHVARWTTWKWVALAVVGTGSVMTAKAVLTPRAPYAEAPRVVAQPTTPHVGEKEARRQPPVARPLPLPTVPEPTTTPAPATPVISVTSLPIAPPVPAPLAPPHPARVIAPNAPIASTPVVAATPASPTTTAPPQPSHLALEIASVDGAKRALAAGDGATALQKTEAYDTAFPNGMLAAEAHALHIEALVRLGRNDEARALLVRFQAEHPGSPLLEGLRHVVQ